jgi:hypothetical protein
MPTWVKVGNVRGPVGPPGSAGGGPATSTTLGGIKLAGDLSGTADAPTVPGLVGKYILPSGGIPLADLDSATRSLINNAVQPAALTSGLATKANTSHTHAEVDVTGLISDLAGKAATSHTHAQTDITGLGSALAAKADLVGGKIPQAQLPAVALTDYLGTVANEAAMLALTGQRGDWCWRSDTGTEWQLVADNPALLNSWQEHHYPASPVQSVAGRTGAVTLSKTDVGLSNVDNTADTAKPVSTAQAAAIAAKYSLPVGGVPKTDLASAVQTSLGLADTALQSAPVASVAGKTGAVTLVKGDVGLGNVDNTSDVNKPISTATQSALDLKAALTVTNALDTRVTTLEGRTGNGQGSVYPLSAYGFFTASADLDLFGKAGEQDPINEIFFSRIFVPAGKAITCVAALVTVAGATPGSGLQGFGIYSDDGSQLLYSSPAPVLWTSTGWHVDTLGTPIAAQGADRFVYVGRAATGYGTAPFMPYCVIPALLTQGGGNGVSHRRSFYLSPGTATWPTSINPATAGTDAGGYIPLITLG